ncbi:MAG: tRNA (N(6)-L-threonylcarbamoyladenosine(37)-C(2))-methylthiotransferase MtaB, partial [Gemmatimonadetes bacterium]|nr:tRNA (N(6)-L-threonylcarbamoyladenosine(37)-C(2))-methylthiotransferase MtaB [Gemmatimonadota bacterium]
MPRAAVHTLGCRLNQAESALLADAFRTRGYEIVADSDPADLYVINSCSVTRGAEAKCRRLVRYLLKRTPDAHVVVTGCYAQLDAKALARIDGVDLVVGTEEKHRLPDLVGSLAKRPETEIRKIPMSRDAFTLPETGLFQETRANLKIQD